MYTRLLSFLLAVISILISNRAMAAEAGLTVFVSIAPQKYIVRQIGQHLVEIHIMVPAGASPATYEPKPQQMVTLAHSAIYFSIGVPFENAWLSKIAAANTSMRVVATDQGIRKRPMQSDHHHGHGHGKHADEDHDDHATTLDPHIWLSPPLVLRQARTILSALQQADPINGDLYAANFNFFAKQTQELDDQLREMFANLQGASFMVYHPSWGYFAQAYGLRQVPLEIEGKAPKPSQLKQLIEFARHEKVRAIFVQPQFSAKSANLIAKAIDAKVIVADPLAIDWAANLRRQATAFKEALR